MNKQTKNPKTLKAIDVPNWLSQTGHEGFLLGRRGQSIWMPQAMYFQSILAQVPWGSKPSPCSSPSGPYPGPPEPSPPPRLKRNSYPRCLALEVLNSFSRRPESLCHRWFVYLATARARDQCRPGLASVFLPLLPQSSAINSHHRVGTGRRAG